MKRLESTSLDYVTCAEKITDQGLQFFIKKDSTAFVKNLENDFYQLCCPSPNEKYDQINTWGWKFHIAVGPGFNYHNNIAKAWKIIQDIAQKQNIGTCKIVAINRRMTGKQTGKEITIYTGPDISKTPEDWCNILSEITIKLAEANVTPGKHAQSHDGKVEHEMHGKNIYITRRFEQESETPLSRDSDNTAEQPTDDPYEKMDMRFIACARRYNDHNKEAKAEPDDDIRPKSPPMK